LELSFATCVIVILLIHRGRRYAGHATILDVFPSADRKPPVRTTSGPMQAALRGVPPAPLPGLAGIGWMASAAPSPQPAASTPPAPHGGNRQSSGGSLDFWLLDKLFGQR
jgi:hypothetical protein